MKISLITGGSSGIGLACVKHFIKRGDKVIVLDISKPDAIENSLLLDYIHCDVADHEQMNQAAKYVLKNHGPIDNLVNCAGIIQKALEPGKLSINDWDKVIDVDFRGSYLSCQLFGDVMAHAGKGGSIVNIASIAGRSSVPLHAYGPAKAAVISMTKCLATEWGRFGVRVNSISPGYTLTPALKVKIDNGERDVSLLADNTALGRMVLPHEIADAVGFLSSDLASAITGVDLAVDAGWLVGTSWASYGGPRRPDLTVA